MKISSLIFALTEVQSSLMAEPLKRKLSATIIKELKKEGTHASLLGKLSLQQYYQSRLDAIIDAESCFPTLSVEGQKEVNDLQSYLTQLDESIDSIEASQNICTNSHPAADALLQVISGNSSIEGAQVFTYKPGHKAVMIFPFLENGMLLRKEDLKQLLQVIDLYNPANGI